MGAVLAIPLQWMIGIAVSALLVAGLIVAAMTLGVALTGLHWLLCDPDGHEFLAVLALIAALVGALGFLTYGCWFVGAKLWSPA